MRARGLTAGLLAVLAAAIAPAASGAAEQISAEAMWRFGASSYEIDQGEAVTFFNGDFLSPGPHDVTATDKGADGKPLFASATVPHGDTVPVARAQELRTGSYGFFCSVHTFMTANLVVNDKGTPQAPASGPAPSAPQPQSSPPRDTTKARLKAALVPTSLRKALSRSRGFVATIGADEPVKLSLRLTARAGRRTVVVGTASGVDDGSGASSRFRIGVGPRARKALARASKAVLVLRVRALDEGGNVTSATVRRTVRR